MKQLLEKEGLILTLENEIKRYHDIESQLNFALEREKQMELSKKELQD